MTSDHDPKATTLLRFRDLVQRGIINNWPTLQARIKDDGFPRGRMLGKNTRAWTVAEIEDWINSRPVKGPAPKGAAAPDVRRRGRPRKVVAEVAAEA